MIEQSRLPVSHICDNMGLNKSTYYNWKNSSENPKSDKGLRQLMQKIALEFPFYGYRRVTKELNRRGIQINHKKVLKLMREENILCRRKKKFRPVTTQSNHNCRVYPNLAKDIEVTGLNQVWVADITYVGLPREFIYLSSILDRFSRKCIGWHLGRDIGTCLTLNALNMAIKKRKFIGFSRLVHHSDQGVQYASNDYVKRLNEFGIRISMSRKGNVYDNAFAESFNKTLKVEEVYINEYETFDDALNNIRKFIEKVYNAKRLHSSIGYKSPNKFEQEVLNINLT